MRTKKTGSIRVPTGQRAPKKTIARSGLLYAGDGQDNPWSEAALAVPVIKKSVAQGSDFERNSVFGLYFLDFPKFPVPVQDDCGFLEVRNLNSS